jgi:GH24 family phage-related lysozyme (muramidase)
MAGMTSIAAGVGLERSSSKRKEQRLAQASADRAKRDAKVMRDNYLDMSAIAKEPYMRQREMHQRTAQALAGLQEGDASGVSADANMAAGLAGQGIRQGGFAFAPTKDSRETSLDALIDSVYDHMVDREGLETTVYKDSRGKPTVGIGHLVTKADGLKVGDKISEEKVKELYSKDIRKAAEAAQSQASELGIDDEEFIKALVSVNFQLGTEWNKKFSDTYAIMKEGRYEEAINNIENSLWYKQTPTRAKDFINTVSALRKAPGARGSDPTT